MNHADADGRIGIIKTNRKEVVVAIENDRKFTGCSVAILFANAVRENPGMSRADLRFGGGPKSNMKALTVQG
jgi:hypothetical protein